MNGIDFIYRFILNTHETLDKMAVSPQVIVLLKHIYDYRNEWLVLVDFDTVYLINS